MVTEIITKIIDAIISNIDFMYLFAVNLITYLGIKIVDELNKDKVVGTWTKRLIALLSAIVLALPLVYLEDDNIKVYIYSFILSFFSWDFIFKPIANKLKIGYKDARTKTKK